MQFVGLMNILLAIDFVQEGPPKSNSVQVAVFPIASLPSPSPLMINACTPTTPSANQPSPINTTPSSTTEQINPFSSLEALKTFLAGHIKTRKPLEQIQAGFYSKDDRQQVTYVTTAKLIDTYGTLPPIDCRI